MNEESKKQTKTIKKQHKTINKNKKNNQNKH